VETWKLIFTGVSAVVALLSAIASAVAWWRSREAKVVAERKRDEAVDAATRVAAAADRIAEVQESRKTAEESTQASSVVFVRSITVGNRNGWRVHNDSDQPVRNVSVRSTAGAMIQVYNNNLDRMSEYVEHNLGAHQQSQLCFRLTDGEGLRPDASEVERMAVRFTDAREQTWERVGTQQPTRVAP
jgi:hypothetical protein